jgi:tetratricopeptide (TPR) repeat protein
MTGEERARLAERFDRLFRADPESAFRDWFRLQEELLDRGDAEAARMLADRLWLSLDDLSFDSNDRRSRFFHNAGVFFGSAGPAADLARARACFSSALEAWRPDTDPDAHARVMHNLANALNNLGRSAEELEEAVSLYERALAHRTGERETARSVTLHNMGIALRRRAEMEEKDPGAWLARSESALREAVAIRARRGLPRGEALSLLQLGATLGAIFLVDGGARRGEAEECLSAAAGKLQALDMAAEAAQASEWLRALLRG